MDHRLWAFHAVEGKLTKATPLLRWSEAAQVGRGTLQDAVIATSEDEQASLRGGISLDDEKTAWSPIPHGYLGNRR